MYSHTLKNQLELQLREAVDTITNSPYGQIYLELHERNYIINQIINLRENSEYKLSMVHTINQNIYFKETILRPSQTRNTKSMNIYRDISEFLKINDCGHIALTKNAKGLIKVGRLDIITCMMNEIENLCDNYFYRCYMIKIYNNLCFDNKIIFRSSSIDKLQKNLESFIRICNKIQKSLQKINRRTIEYMEKSPIKTEVDYVSSLRLQMFLIDLDLDLDLD